jgi:hypothetical protein
VVRGIRSGLVVYLLLARLWSHAAKIETQVASAIL